MRFSSGYIILFFLLVLNPGNAPGMVFIPADSSVTIEDIHNERFELITDRNLYAVSEKIQFKAFNTSPSHIKRACWSKVLYVQLINQSGSAVKKGKFKLSCSGVHGFLVIPKHIPTGNYYLVAYTKWMRNFSPRQYDFQAVKIINPYSTEVEGHTRLDSLRTITDAGKEIPEKYETGVICKTDKSNYQQGEEVIFSIHSVEMQGLEPLQVTAVIGRPGAIDTLPSKCSISEHFDSRKRFELNFLPDIRGLSVSGKIVLKNSTEPVEDAHVELSILGNDPGFYVFKTKRDGKFYFALDSISGDHELFIATRHHEIKELDILIDKDFTDFPVDMFHEPFVLSDTEKRLAREIMINMQAEKIYSIPDSSGPIKPAEGKSRSVFHNIVLDPLLIDNYVKLPNLKEVFIELVPEVMTLTRKNKTIVYCTGNTVTGSLMQILEPLILVDQLPIYDLENLLSAPPDRIRSIEVLNEIYVVGHTVYGGIINITSKKSDVAGIDLPVNSFFFPYSGYETPEYPEFSNRHNEYSNTPDFRNSLFWEPDIEIMPGQTKTFRINIWDRSGRYMILIRGIRDDGSHFQAITYFEVD